MDPLIGSAPADVAGHRIDDLPVGRLRCLLEQRGGLHDLARLAVAALGDVIRDPGALDWVSAIGAEAFDCRDLMACGRSERRDAGADRFAIQMHCARATRPDAAAELGPGQTENVA